LSAIQTLKEANSIYDIARIVNNLDISKRIARGGAVETEIPDNQWIIEIKGWENYVWSAVRTYVADYATGPRARDPQAADLYEIKAATPGDKKLCGMQRMRKSGGFV